MTLVSWSPEQAGASLLTQLSPAAFPVRPLRLAGSEAAAAPLRSAFPPLAPREAAGAGAVAAVLGLLRTAQHGS